VDKLSIVVTSYDFNRINDIHDLLDSIKFQTYQDIETIYVVERSVGLYDAVREYCKGINLSTRVIYTSQNLGLGGARNLGSKEAKGEVIAFVDDDVVLNPDWAEKMVGSYSGDVIGVTGSEYPLWQDKDLEWLPEKLYWLISCTNWTDWNEITEARSLWGGNMSFLREAFERAGSFLPSLGFHQPMAEDLEFSIRVKKKTGKKLLFNPNVKAGHKIYGYRLSFKFVALRSHHIGVSRRLLKSTYLKDYVSFNNEGKVLNGMLKTIMNLYKNNPKIAWKKLQIVSTVMLFSGIGYLFPGKGLTMVEEINEVGR
jgi:glycosyltransferase involved in cell wall biosynthesis